VLAALALPAHATFHLWRINEAYSNPDGSVQFVELVNANSNENLLAGHSLQSRNPNNTPRATFDFLTNLPPGETAGKSVLIATAGFAALAGVTPDYTLPAAFLNPQGGNVNFAGVDAVTFGAYSTDTSQSTQRNLTFATATPKNFAGVVGARAVANPAVALVSSVLPASRAVGVGVNATAFATIINGGSAAGSNCLIAPVTSLPATFFYQTTDPNTNAPVGLANTPVTINAGAFQTFVFGFTPTAAFAPIDVQMRFGCGAGDNAPVFTGINTLLLSASGTPGPDVVALVATVQNDGIVHIPGTTGTGFFTIASVNLGASGVVEVTAGTGNALLPLTAAICQTDPVTSVCINPTAPAGFTSLTIAPNATPTFAVFVAGTENIALDPAGKRIFVQFYDPNLDIVRGMTSVAVQTDVAAPSITPGDPPGLY
jgi:hypothetical protein